MQLQAKRPLYVCASIWHPTEVQFALIRNRFWPAAQRLPGAMEEGGRPKGPWPQLTTTTLKTHPPMLHGQHVAHPCRGQLTILLNAEPQHRSRSASRPQRLCGQPQRGGQVAGRWGASGFKGAASHFPGTASAPQPATGVENGWVSQAPLSCRPSGLSCRFSSCLLLGPMGRWAPAGADSSGQCHAKYKTAGGPAGPQDGAWWWDANRHVQLPFDARGLRSAEMRPGLRGCEEERARSQVKAACQSWGDDPTNVQVRWRRATHLGSHGEERNMVDRCGAWHGPIPWVVSRGSLSRTRHASPLLSPVTTPAHLPSSSPGCSAPATQVSRAGCLWDSLTWLLLSAPAPATLEPPASWHISLLCSKGRVFGKYFCSNRAAFSLDKAAF